MSRGLVRIGLALTCIFAGASPVALATPGYAADADGLLELIRTRYAYLDPERTDLACVEQRLLPNARGAADDGAFVSALESILAALADHHAHLGVNRLSSPQLVPSGADLAAEFRAGVALVTGVRPEFPAQRASVVPGDEIVAVDEVPVEAAVAAAISPCTRADRPEVRHFALLRLLAGTHLMERRITLRRDGALRTVVLAPTDEAPRPAAVSHRRLAQGIGYVAVGDLGSENTVAMFHAALAELRDSVGLILDLRDTAAGGGTSVAEPILGRFFSRRAAYQRIVPIHGKPWLRKVRHRGPWTYGAPVVVLVGPWTASMGEAVAIGFDASGRGTVVGTRMAGLRGAVFQHVLPHTKINVSLPGERLTHLDGTPREDYEPAIVIDLAQARSNPDPTLARAIALLTEAAARGASSR